jgi:hypothetical protein
VSLIGDREDLVSMSGDTKPPVGVGRELSRDPDFAEKLVRTPGWEKLVKAGLERYTATNAEPWVIRHRLQVTSYGGSGTTALCRHFSAAGLDMPDSPDHWPFKHTRSPPAAGDVPEGFRTVYVYADPRDAVLSLFRRGLQVGAYRVFHIEEPPPEVEWRLQKLDRYVGAGIDDYALDQHLQQWLDHPPGYPVLFLDFESLPGTWPQVRDFVGLPQDYPCLEIRTRRSPIASVDEATAAGLTAMYQGLLDRIDALPSVHIVE